MGRCGLRRRRGWLLGRELCIEGVSGCPLRIYGILFFWVLEVGCTPRLDHPAGVQSVDFLAQGQDQFQPTHGHIVVGTERESWRPLRTRVFSQLPGRILC